MSFAAALCGENLKLVGITPAQISERLRAGLQAEPLPGTDGHIRAYAEAHGYSPRCAAVLIPMTFFADEWHLLFIRRAEDLHHHSGQVAFPGGRCDPEDGTPEETALREADEEVGLKRTDIQLLGRVQDVITVTNYQITPVVGVFPWAYAFVVATEEVSRVFTMPLNWLADPKNYWEFQHPQAKHPTIAYHPFDGELLWGATARITINFLKTILK